MSGCSYKPSPEDKKREDNWKAESDVRTLTEAAEIRADKARFKRAQAKAAEMAKAAQATAAAVADKK